MCAATLQESGRNPFLTVLSCFENGPTTETHKKAKFGFFFLRVESNVVTRTKKTLFASQDL